MTNPRRALYIPGHLFHDGIGIWVDESTGYPATAADGATIYRKENEMNTKHYGFSDATVQITRTNGAKFSIFDVSRTIECRWICIGDERWQLLAVFDDTRAMLKFVATEQIHGATVPNDDGWLDDQAGIDGFDTWKEFVDSVRLDNEVEFRTYHDSQGREHAEF